ncbi:MAG: hypothetical protein U9Q33_11150 [Campylobacterota bacterium]|nr:hypothetical protein [Campylobacterota bacterium]
MKLKYLSLIAVVFLSGCSLKSFNDQMIEKAKKDINETSYYKIKNSYSETLVKREDPAKNYVSILKDKSLSAVLKELELIDGKYYYLKSGDMLIPKSRVKIDSFLKLSRYLSAVVDKALVIKKINSMDIVEVVDKSESEKLLFSKIPFKLEGEISADELIKLITLKSGFEISVGNDMGNFKDQLILVKSDSLIDAINTLQNSRNFYVDINYKDKKINLTKYKNVVIELNIPMMNLRTSQETSSQETSGQNRVSNISSVFLYDELNSMIKNITSSDKSSSYHIDKSSGLIYLKSTKDIEDAVRDVVRAYEESFSKEAIIEFERIELILNKSQEYGIAGFSAGGKDTKGTFSRFDGTPNINITGSGFNFQKLDQLTASANNQIGHILNYSKNMIVLKNNIPTVQSLSQNTDYLEQIDKTILENNNISIRARVGTIKDGTSLTALAKISRDKIFLNITPNIKKLNKLKDTTFDNFTIQLPEYKDQSYNISKEINLGETVVVGSIIVHDDAKEYEGILPIEGFAIGGSDSKSYVRREIVFIVTLKSLKGF